MKKHMEIIEWIHATLIFALFIPIASALGVFPVLEGTVIFYLRCLLIAVPVAVTGIAVRRTKTLWGYILVCMILLAAVYGAAAGVSYLLGLGDDSASCYRIGMSVETVTIALIRAADRIKRIRYTKERKIDSSAMLSQSFLNRPSLDTWYFVGIYIIGLLFGSKLLCDLTLFSAFIYWFFALAYRFFETTDHYFVLNKRTKGIPKRRLYTISGGILCLFAGFIFVAVLPSFLLINARRYVNIREWSVDVPLVPYSDEADIEFWTPFGGDMGGPSMPADSAWDMPEPLAIWDNLYKILEIVVAIALFMVIVAVIREIFQDFRKVDDENGDKVEDIEDVAECERVTVTVHKPDRETSDIKRRYKRMIRKYRKERPAAYEAPAEIEEKAGLADDAEMQELHAEYERVRYGRHDI